MSGSDGLPLVCARALGVRYGPVDVLRGVDLELRAGEHVAVTGRSGSGKTTLLFVLAGLLAATSGSVCWPGLATEPRRRRAAIGMVFQAPSLMPELTALQNVMLPARLRGVDVEAARVASMSAMAAVGGADFTGALPAQLSGGQQQRTAIARALAGRHTLVLADEPTGALDRVHAHDVALALRDSVAAAGGGLVVATHDPELADMFDRRIAVVDGKLTPAAAA